MTARDLLVVGSLGLIVVFGAIVWVVDRLLEGKARHDF